MASKKGLVHCSKAAEDDLIYCPICFGEFDNPRSLPCLHAFCYKCLDKLCKDRKNAWEESVECPICRRICEIPSPEGVAGFPPNFFIQRLVDVRKGSSASHKCADFCEGCADEQKTVTATKYCIDCRLRLCEKCSKLRTHPTSHRIKEIGAELDCELERIVSMYCIEHANKVLEIYCKNCNRNACTSCLDEEKHSGHDFVTIEAAATFLMDQISSDVAKVKARLDEMVQQDQLQRSALKNFCDRMTSIANEVDKQCTAIRSYVEKLIDKGKEQILEKLKFEQEKSLKIFSLQEESNSLSLVCMTSFMNFSDELRNKGKRWEITRAGIGVHERAWEILSNYHVAEVYNGTAVQFRAENVQRVFASVIENNIVGCLVNTRDQDGTGVVNSVRQTDSPQTSVAATGKTLQKKDDISRPMTSTKIANYRKRLQQLYPQIIEKLSANPVAAELYRKGELSLAELQKVQSSGTAVEAAEHLLNRLLDQRSDASYDVFLSALQATNQEHIFLWLTYEDYNIDSRHTDLIRQHYTFLRDNMDLQSLGFIHLLYQETVIERAEMEHIESGEGCACRADRLLCVLSRKSVEQFERFLVALHQTKQSYVAKQLRRNPSRILVKPSADNTQQDTHSSRSLVAHTNTITHVIAASGDRQGQVAGLTVSGKELFIVRWETKGRIEVYNAMDFSFQRNILVKAFENISRMEGLTSCDINKCLYVSDWFGVQIFKVELTGNNKVVKWSVEDGQPFGLSVNGKHNLMVACSGPPNKLTEYTTSGERVREIFLQDDFVEPHHAIQLSSNEFLVCHGYRDSLHHRVAVVDTHGQVLHSYGNKRGSETGQLNEPRQLAVCTNRSIFVADSGNNRVLILDSSLKKSRDLQIDGTGVDQPYCLYLDEKRSLLIIGEWNGIKSRVVVVRIRSSTW